MKILTVLGLTLSSHLDLTIQPTQSDGAHQKMTFDLLVHWSNFGIQE